MTPAASTAQSALLSLGEPEAQERLASRIVAEGLSVRAVEEIVAVGSDESPPRRPARPAAKPPTAKRQPCPEGMAVVASRFCIDRWEASLVEITASGERPFSPYETPQGRAVRAVTGAGTVPQGYMSRDQADAA